MRRIVFGAHRCCFEEVRDRSSALALLERVFLDSAAWRLSNPSLARLALSPTERPALEPPAERPSFQQLVRAALVLGQRQGLIRGDENPNFMALVLLGIYGQAMLTALASGSVDQGEVRKILRVVVEGLGARN